MRSKKMSIQCPKKLFEFFENCGGWAKPDEKGQIFLYEALYAGFQYSNLISIDVPALDNKTFNEWDKFEYWCDDIKGLQMWDIVDERINNAEFDDNNDYTGKYLKIIDGSMVDLGYVKDIESIVAEDCNNCPPLTN